jgi:alpha-tubulin suppressor-like RCC1 family protein
VWGVLAIVVIAACGRIDFDPLGGTGIPPGGGVAQLATGQQHSCLRTDQGALYCWGIDDMGELGQGAAHVGTNALAPLAIGGATWRDVAPGWRHVCALDDAGAAWCWGSNGNGQLGTGSAAATIADPTPVGDGRRYVRIFSGDYHTCAIATDHTLWCWGRNGAQELGLGDSADRNTPQQVLIVAPQTGPDDQWAFVGPGSDHTCAIMANMSLWCWGSNANGQLGQNGNPTIVRNRPEVVTPGSTWQLVEAGSDFECALGDDTYVYCVGRNDMRQLGSTSPDSDVPLEIAAIDHFARIGVGLSHACAVRDSSELYCWGENPNGELGIGTSGAPSGPVQVTGTWRDVQAGNGHTCALDTTGAAWCWGLNKNGQLGTGDMTDSLVPVAVAF